MVKKKVDPRILGLIVDGVKKNHRSMFILVGDYGKDQVENLHKILSKTRVRARPNVLWCYKKELGFSTHRKKRIKEIKRDQSRGIYDSERDDPFELFISSTDIRWTYYKETDKILGQTFGMVVLQDFEAITPNLLARTIETVEGGGLVIILLKTVKSLKQLYTMTMDVHNRFRTEAHHEVIPRFNERFILSISECKGCLVLDDELNILPISTFASQIFSLDGEELSSLANVSAVTEDPELIELKASLETTPNAGNLIQLTKTIDQAKAVLSFLDAISEKTLRYTVALTAARGRGKSAAIGLCLAGAVAYGYSNIFITAPSPENLKTAFEFIIIGLKALKYVEHIDFEILQEHQNDIGKVVVRINIYRNHRQTIQYILPTDSSKLAQAELVAIDEAAAIPLPTVKKLLGPYLVFLSSTVNGYEGTGRALSLKLIQQLRSQQGQSVVNAANEGAKSIVGSKSMKGERKVHEERWKTANELFNSNKTSRTLTEITLEVPIRYSKNDPIESWLNGLLCLDVTSHSTRMLHVMPAPKDCELYIVNRDALFSYHKLSETLLQKIWALYTSAHYKNSPNDLQMLSDAPAHRLFVLLGPQNPNSTALPDILCVIQIAFEGLISQKSIQSELSKSNKASGDLIPWTISQQFNDTEFATLSGARIVRIATHPDVQKMGYGSRAIDLLNNYFSGELNPNFLDQGIFGGEGSVVSTDNTEDISNDTSLITESIQPRKQLPSLLSPLADRQPEQLHWIGVSFGLTTQLLNFWTKKCFKVCYVRQTSNDLTGEHSCIVLKENDLSQVIEVDRVNKGWLGNYVSDYRRRLVSLLNHCFRHFDITTSMMLLDPDRLLTSTQDNNALIESNKTFGGQLSGEELLSVHLSYHDMKRLELYERNMVDHHMILDLLSTLSRFVFNHRLLSLHLSHLQVAILLAVGLQARDMDSIAVELNLPVNQVLAFFNKTIRKITSTLRILVEEHTLKIEFKSSDKTIANYEKHVNTNMNALSESLSGDQHNDEIEYKKQSKNIINAVNNSLKYQSDSSIPLSVSIPKEVIENETDISNDKTIHKIKKKKDKKFSHDHKPKKLKLNND